MGDFEKVELSVEETTDTAPAGELEEAVTEVKEEELVRPERPEWLQEKFKTVEDLAKAYDEAQRKISELSPPKAVEEGRVDMDALTAEMKDHGKLSDTTYDQMEKKGIGREVMDRYVAGQQALAREVTQDLAKIAGGKEGLDTVMAWAKDNLDEQDKLAYNNAIESADLPGARLALRGVVAAYVDANGREPSLVTGAESVRGPAGAAPFADRSQMVAAINDPKYHKSPAYRKEVEDRIRVSDF